MRGNSYTLRTGRVGRNRISLRSLAANGIESVVRPEPLVVESVPITSGKIQGCNRNQIRAVAKNVLMFDQRLENHSLSLSRPESRPAAAVGDFRSKVFFSPALLFSRLCPLPFLLTSIPECCEPPTFPPPRLVD